MRIIDATVTKARRCRDWGRIEAIVSLTYEIYPGGPVETRRMLTSVAARDPKGRDLRTSLVTDAVRLAATTAAEPIAEAA